MCCRKKRFHQRIAPERNASLPTSGHSRPSAARGMRFEESAAFSWQRLPARNDPPFSPSRHPPRPRVRQTQSCRRPARRTAWPRTPQARTPQARTLPACSERQEPEHASCRPAPSDLRGHSSNGHVAPALRDLTQNLLNGVYQHLLAVVGGNGNANRYLCLIASYSTDLETLQSHRRHLPQADFKKTNAIVVPCASLFRHHILSSSCWNSVS